MFIGHYVSTAAILHKDSLKIKNRNNDARNVLKDSINSSDKEGSIVVHGDCFVVPPRNDASWRDCFIVPPCNDASGWGLLHPAIGTLVIQTLFGRDRNDG